MIKFNVSAKKLSREITKIKNMISNLTLLKDKGRDKRKLLKVGWQIMKKLKKNILLTLILFLLQFLIIVNLNIKMVSEPSKNCLFSAIITDKLEKFNKSGLEKSKAYIMS